MKHHRYYVYLLLCSNNTYYTGVTNDIERRLAEHQSCTDLGSYTSRFSPVELVFYTSFSDIELAIKKEKQIKHWSQAKKKALIQGEFEELPNLSKKRFK